MITLVCGLIAAIIFFLEFFGVKIEGHNIMFLALFFLALAVAFSGFWPWRGNRNNVGP